ncbi:MAG: carbon-nitrogen hydrolase family protein [Gemmataceae bacterium]
MSEKWIVAGVQMNCTFADKAANTAAIIRKLNEAADRGAKLVVFPECILTGYGFESRAQALGLGEKLPGLSTGAIARMRSPGRLGRVQAVESLRKASCSTRRHSWDHRDSWRDIASCTCPVSGPIGSRIQATGRSPFTISEG